jgi:hypothetical protein
LRSLCIDVDDAGLCGAVDYCTKAFVLPALREVSFDLLDYYYEVAMPVLTTSARTLPCLALDVDSISDFDLINSHLSVGTDSSILGIDLSIQLSKQVPMLKEHQIFLHSKWKPHA